MLLLRLHLGGRVPCFCCVLFVLSCFCGCFWEGYFFKSEKTLNNFVSNVNENLKSNGLLVTTFIDAKSLLTKSSGNKYKSNIVDIKIGKTNEKLTGNKVTVALKGTKYFGTGGSSKEFLVKSEDFIERMKSEGFKVVDNIQFDRFFVMTLTIMKSVNVINYR